MVNRSRLAALALLAGLAGCADFSAYDQATLACQQERYRNANTPPPGLQLTPTARCTACRPPEDFTACHAWWQLRMAGGPRWPDSFPAHIIDAWRSQELVSHY